MIAYRIHPVGEPRQTMLDPTRPDGWVASDEDYARQPHGVSAAPTLEDLFHYVRRYSMNVRPGDRVFELRGRAGDADRDAHAVRVVATRCRYLGDAVAWAKAYDLDLDDLGDRLADDEVPDLPRPVACWLRRRLTDGGIYDASPRNRKTLSLLAERLPIKEAGEWKP